MNPLNEVTTISEAANLWGITPDAIRHKIFRGRFEPQEIRKTDSIKGEWLILKSAMIRLYGPPK